MHDNPDLTRRSMLRTLAAVPFAFSVPALIGCATGASAAPTLAPTASCPDDDDDSPTEAQTEGPYFKRSSPLRTSLLESGITGTTLIVTGTVYTRSCVPVAGALLDFWQADNGGNYDNSGFKLRGHQFTDANGVYRLETIVPGLYPGRTRHLHVKVQSPSGPILTTQLYFPGEARNASDGIYDADLLLAITEGSASRNARFDFVLNLA